MQTNLPAYFNYTTSFDLNNLFGRIVERNLEPQTFNIDESQGINQAKVKSEIE
jgi:hypothetical protein